MQSNSQIKRVFNQIARPLLAAGIMAVIIGCSAFEPEYGECQNLLPGAKKAI